MKKPAHPLAWLVTLALPVLLGFMNIRLLISPAFLRWEYNKPNFPADRYGFTKQERLELAPVAVEFLASPESPDGAIRLLREQSYDGEPLYDQRELDHMVDVKRRTDIMFRMMWAAGAIVVLGTAVLAWRPRTRPAAWQGLFNGSILTGLILAAILAYILIGWNSFFTRFHELLFPPGTWTFDYSTTLIRLFPEKFWFDVGVLIGAGTLVDAALIGLVAHWLGRRAARVLPG
jgi:integral membrane protein (TIGR01906 family)